MSQEKLSQQRISEEYSLLLHVSGGSIASKLPGSVESAHHKGVAKVYDGVGNTTGLSLSSKGNRVVINNYIQPEGWQYQMEWIDAFFPINTVLVTATYKNPGIGMRGTKWILQSQGLFPVGVGSGLDKNNNTFTFSAGNRDREKIENGDAAGEFRSDILIEDLPAHSHLTDTHTETVPVNQEGLGTNVSFIFYFGDTLNTSQLTRGDKRYLDDEAIEAFEYNTEYNGIQNYRDHVITERYNSGVFFTDADFEPRFANQTMRGWAPPQAGGPGWGGILNTNGKFIGNSPRPIGVDWTLDGQTYNINSSFYDPRASDRVHPGRFNDTELVKARDFIIHVLGIEKAKEALAGVNRLKEIGQTVEQAYRGDNTYYSRIPQNKIVTSTTAGGSIRHNNIPPNYPLYFWRRVPLTYVENLTITERPGPELPMQFIITSNKKSTKDNIFNLNRWAVDQGWNGQSACTIIIDEGVYIYSDDPNNDKVPGMVIDQFPEGLTLINKGFIMGRGGDGGSYYTDGQDGGDAIHITSNSEIIIDNTNGAIGGGGGGGSASKLGNSGGGGGAGGGWGGTASIFQLPGWNFGDGDGRVITSSEVEANNWSVFDYLDNKPYKPTAAGGWGGAPGQPGGHGRWYNRFWSFHSLAKFKAAGDIMTIGGGPNFPLLPGIGGEAGGSGSVGRLRNGVSDQGSGGGGGRILTTTATGGGTGGVPGAEFGAIDVNGNLRDTGPEWSNTPPRNNGSVRNGVYVTAYNSSRPYRGWNSGYTIDNARGYGYGSHRAIGPHWRRNGHRGSVGLPYIVAGVLKPGSEKGLYYNGFSYLSPTGWDGYNHRSALIQGGSTNQPGIYEPAYVRVIGGVDLWSNVYTEHTAAGGGGWGAPGGVAWRGGRTWRSVMDTRGTGPMIRKAGAGGLSIKATVGNVTVNGGIVYGETEGNVNIR